VPVGKHADDGIIGAQPDIRHGRDKPVDEPRHAAAEGEEARRWPCRLGGARAAHQSASGGQSGEQLGSAHARTHRVDVGAVDAAEERLHDAVGGGVAEAPAHQRAHADIAVRRVRRRHHVERGAEQAVPGQHAGARHRQWPGGQTAHDPRRDAPEPAVVDDAGGAAARRHQVGVEPELLTQGGDRVAPDHEAVGPGVDALARKVDGAELAPHRRGSLEHGDSQGGVAGAQGVGGAQPGDASPHDGDVDARGRVAGLDRPAEKVVTYEKVLVNH